MPAKIARIMRIGSDTASAIANRPNLPHFLFWEYRCEDMDWQAQYKMIISRVLERGNAEEWLEIIRFYGREKVIHALKLEIAYLPEHTISKVCAYFQLRREQLKCHTRKQLRRGYWHQ